MNSKYITVKLTEDQAHYLNNTLSWDEGWVQNNEFPRSDNNNAFIERIRLRIAKALAQAKTL